jgi:Histidine kinase-, DNA gyrase B-, and HSP90-like ATPase
MSIVPKRIRLLAFIAAFWVAWFDIAGGMPAEALSAVKKKVPMLYEVPMLYGERLSIPAMKMTDQGVCDFGTGRPAGESPRIFEQFFSTKREGMGMGLAIVRSIIASHDGELAAANAEGGGACVHFSLPVIAKGREG